MGNLNGQTNNANEAGVLGESGQFEGVRGISHAGHHGGVVGVNDNQTDAAGPGVFGTSKGTGVWGESQTWMGVYGNSKSTTGGAGVMGEAIGTAVIGKSQTSHGVYGQSQDKKGGAGVIGEAIGPGVIGKSQTWHGVYGETTSNVGGAGVCGKGPLAGKFEGDVEVTGDIRLTNADCAEDFDVDGAVTLEPGTVIILGHEGGLSTSHKAYDKCVAGVISGAGDYKPGIVLDKQQAMGNRQPVALLGKVYCKVDATCGSIGVGDLLTTSDTPGHAMKVLDSTRALGAIIGKALRPLKEGQGLIPILIALQ